MGVNGGRKPPLLVAGLESVFRFPAKIQQLSFGIRRALSEAAGQPVKTKLGLEKNP